MAEEGEVVMENSRLSDPMADLALLLGAGVMIGLGALIWHGVRQIDLAHHARLRRQRELHGIIVDALAKEFGVSRPPARSRR